MKKRVSATIEDETKRMLDSLIDNDEFRNKSHVIEKAIKKLWEEKHGKGKK